MRRCACALALLTGTFALLAACKSGVSVDSCDGGVLVDGACVADAGYYYQPCSGRVAAAVPPEDCPSQGCDGIAYAVCNGKAWIPCACAVPVGYTLVDAGFFGPDAGDGGEASDEDATSDARRDDS